MQLRIFAEGLDWLSQMVNLTKVFGDDELFDRKKKVEQVLFHGAKWLSEDWGIGIEDGVGVGVAGFARFMSLFFEEGLLYITLFKGGLKMMVIHLFLSYLNIDGLISFPAYGKYKHTLHIPNMHSESPDMIFFDEQFELEM